MAVLGTLLIILSVGVHELGHAIMAYLFRVPFEYVTIGIPLHIHIGPFNWNGVVVEKQFAKIHWRIGFLPFGGGVQIQEDVFWSTPWWKRLLIALAGPAFSLAFGYIAIALLIGPVKAVGITNQFTQATGQAHIMLIQGDIPLSEINGPVFLVRLMAQVMEQNPWEGALFMLALINISMAGTNLIPIPALDGGQAVIALVSAVIGNKKVRRFADPAVRSTFYLLLVGMIILIAKDLL